MDIVKKYILLVGFNSKMMYILRIVKHNILDSDDQFFNS